MHYLLSENTENKIAVFNSFDSNEIKNKIVEHLTSNPSDTLELCKVSNDKKYVGDDIIDFFAVNPKNQKVSKIITRGTKEYFKELL